VGGCLAGGVEETNKHGGMWLYAAQVAVRSVASPSASAPPNDFGRSWAV
jgi:hypothetical protein